MWLHHSAQINYSAKVNTTEMILGALRLSRRNDHSLNIILKVMKKKVSTTWGPFASPFWPTWTSLNGHYARICCTRALLSSLPTSSSSALMELAAPDRSSSFRAPLSPRQSQLIPRLLPAQQSIHTFTRLCILSQETFIPLISR